MDWLKKNRIAILLGIIAFVKCLAFYFQYAEVYTDSDQTIFWLYTTDLAKGNFYTPYLYGQNYNVPFESFVSLLFYLAGISLPKAFAISGIVMQLLSFALIFLYFNKRKQPFTALSGMALLLLLPTEWLIISTSARGFYGGIFLSLLGFALIHLDANKGVRNYFAYVVIILGFIINPNSLVLIIPFGLGQLFFEKIRWKVVGLALLTGVFLVLILHYYTLTHKQMIIHPAWQIEWSVKDWITSISHFNALFKGVVPVFYEIGASIILYILILGVGIYRLRNKAAFAIYILSVVFIVFSFGINKVTDGSESVYFPYSRMYLALPFVLIFFISLIERQRSFTLKPSVFVFISLLFFSLEQLIAPDRIKRAITTNSGVVQVKNIASLESECNDLSNILEQEEAEAIVIYTKADVLTYGCAAISGINTYYPEYERRLWVKNKFKETSLNDVLILDWQKRIVSDHPELEVIPLNDSYYPLFKVSSTKKLSELFE